MTQLRDESISTLLSSGLIRGSIFVFTAVITCLWSISCGEDIALVRDREPPHIVEIRPEGPIVPSDAHFSLVFSEALSKNSVVEKNIRLVPKSKKRTVKLKAKLDDVGNTIEIWPEEKLKEGETYTMSLKLGVKDLAGNPLILKKDSKTSFEHSFSVARQPTQMVSNDVNDDESNQVPPNRKRFRFVFSNEIIRANVGFVRLIEAESGTEVSLKFIEQSIGAKLLTVFLKDSESCEKLKPSTSYKWLFEDNRFPEISFVTDSKCALAENEFTEPVFESTESSARLKATSKLSCTGNIWFGEKGKSLDCLGQSCPVPLKKTRKKSSTKNEQKFGYGAKVAGLSAPIVYEYRVAFEDDFGARRVWSGEFTTKPDVPDIAPED